MAASFTSLTDLARQIAIERHSDQGSVIKELLQYEIIQALLVSGSANHLVFQGGTALRLCHGGIRYSEDLDLAGGVEFDPLIMKPFSEQIVKGITERYGLSMEVDERLPNQADNVPGGRWKAKVQLPQVDRSAKRGYVIHIEVASVPAYSAGLLRVRTLSDRLPYAYQSLSIRGESKEEILADKILALGARQYLKQRDLWDIHMLHQEQVKVNIQFVWKKIEDYHLDPTEFLGQLEKRAKSLSEDGTVDAFRKEMSRFVDGTNRSLVEDPTITRQILHVVAGVAEGAMRRFETDNPLKIHDISPWPAIQ